MKMTASPFRTITIVALLVSLLVAQPFGAQTQDRGIKPALDDKAEGLPSPGRYYALVIGNNNYQNFQKLKTAEDDARVVEAMLRDKYGFQTRLLLNATRQQILSALSSYRRELDPNANLLIFYAGHGVNDTEADKAYWLPVDAQRTDPSNWISADDITVNIKVIPAKHVLIVSDSCYSGTIVRAVAGTVSTPLERGRYLQKMMAGKSRTLMASGGNEPVVDDGGGGHSVFANALLRGLDQNDKEVFTADELFRDYIQEAVAGKANQTPEYNPLRNSGHDSGDFVFVRVKVGGKTVEVTVKAPKSSPATVDPAAIELSYWETIRNSTDPEDYKAYLDKYPNGQFDVLARNRLKALSAAKPTPETKEPARTANTAAAPTPARPKPGTVVRNNAGIELVYVPAGSFMMGSENGEKYEKPVHQVTIREGFYMGRYEVTQAQWQAVMGTNPSEFRGENLPVEQVSWNDAQEFIQKLNALNDGFIYRLPSEAEWEYACRAGTTGDYAGEPNSMGWYDANSGKRTHPVGKKQANGFGLYDMHGNVWEWCQDVYHENYNGAPTDGSTWLSGGDSNKRVFRGGSWFNVVALILRSALRNRAVPDFRSHDLGFRVAASART